MERDAADGHMSDGGNDDEEEEEEEDDEQRVEEEEEEVEEEEEEGGNEPVEDSPEENSVEEGVVGVEESPAVVDSAASSAPLATDGQEQVRVVASGSGGSVVGSVRGFVRRMVSHAFAKNYEDCCLKKTG